MPRVIDWLYDHGWDVVYMNRHGPRYTAYRHYHGVAIARAVEDLRGDGYARVIVAGQSSGGTYSMVATAGDLNPYGLLLMASGPSDDNPPFLDMLDTANAGRVAVIHFKEDKTLGQRSPSFTYMILARKPHTLNIFEPSGITGHSGGYSNRFARRFGDCLVTFFDPARTPTGQECDRH